MDWRILFSQYRYPIIGALIGLLLALFLITFGIFKTIVIIIFMIAGVFVASYLKQTGIIDRLFK